MILNKPKMAHSCDLPKMARLQCDNYGQPRTIMDYELVSHYCD